MSSFFALDLLRSRVLKNVPPPMAIWDPLSSANCTLSSYPVVSLVVGSNRLRSRSGGNVSGRTFSCLKAAFGARGG